MSRNSPTSESSDPFAAFHPVTAAWFRAVFDAPTAPQRMGWPAIARGESALILAPTGTGKTLTAFLWCLDRLMLHGSHPSDKSVAWMGHPLMLRGSHPGDKDKGVARVGHPVHWDSGLPWIGLSRKRLARGA